jgi:AcrR family transcriptional regulator
MLNGFYAWAARGGMVTASPVAQRRRPSPAASSQGHPGPGELTAAAQARDARRDVVEWLTPAQYRSWRDAGYRAAKVSDIAARVGVSEPVIFQNFGSKAALFAAVVERAAAEVRTSLDQLAQAPGPAAGLLAHVLAGPAHAGRGAGHPGTDLAGGAYGVMFADAVALTGEPELTGPARDAVRAVAAHLADLIRRAQSGGDAWPGTDPDAAAWLLLSVLSARRLRAEAMPPGLEPQVTALALRALIPPAP